MDYMQKLRVKINGARMRGIFAISIIQYLRDCKEAKSNDIVQHAKNTSGLTLEEKSLQTPKGEASAVEESIRWSLNMLKQAKFVVSPGYRRYQITELGEKNVLSLDDYVAVFRQVGVIYTCNKKINLCNKEIEEAHNRIKFICHESYQQHFAGETKTMKNKKRRENLIDILCQEIA